MYSRVDSDGAARLFTGDFTLVLYSETGRGGVISSSAVIISCGGRKTIRTCANVRASSYWYSRPTSSECIYCVPDCISRKLRNMLPMYIYHIPYSEQSKIMELLGDVLY